MQNAVCNLVMRMLDRKLSVGYNICELENSFNKGVVLLENNALFIPNRG